MSFLFFLQLLQTVFEQLFHRGFKQVKQRLFVDDLCLVQIERKLAQVFHEDGRIGVSVHFHHIVLCELLGDELASFHVCQMRWVIDLHTTQVQRGELL